MHDKIDANNNYYEDLTMIDFDIILAPANETPVTKPDSDDLTPIFKRIKREKAIAEQLGTDDPEVIAAIAKKLDDDDSDSDSEGPVLELKPSWATPPGPSM